MRALTGRPQGLCVFDGGLGPDTAQAGTRDKLIQQLQRLQGHGCNGR